MLPALSSTDIDVTKVTLESFQAMKEFFPEDSDETIVRYLIARNNNVQKAKDLLTECHSTRQKLFPVLKDDCGKEFPIGKLYCNGYDKEGKLREIFSTFVPLNYMEILFRSSSDYLDR